jgi:hypothetical protein
MLAVTYSVGAHEYSSDVDDEAFWAADTLLAARIDSLGREVVVQEVERALREAIEAYSDTSAIIEHEQLQEWVQAIRWATILRDDKVIPPLEAITQLELRKNQVDVYYRFTYLARWGLYRIRTEALSSGEKTDILMDDFFSEDQFLQVFVQDRIMELGSEALPSLIDFARENIVPRMDELDKELTSEEDLRFVTDYLYFTDFLKVMIETDGDKALFEGLLRDPAPHVQTFAEDVLEGLEEIPEEAE